VEPITVFVPRADTIAASAIRVGAGVVGTFYDDHVLADFDYGGSRYQAEMSYADRVMHAADRHRRNYPTVARGLFHRDDLTAIGFYDGDVGRVILLGGDSEKALAAWLGRAVEPADLVTTTVQHQLRRHLDETLASGDPRPRLITRQLARRLGLEFE
jgi:hypothetical protein